MKRSVSPGAAKARKTASSKRGRIPPPPPRGSSQIPGPSYAIDVCTNAATETTLNSENENVTSISSAQLRPTASVQGGPPRKPLRSIGNFNTPGLDVHGNEHPRRTAQTDDTTPRLQRPRIQQQPRGSSQIPGPSSAMYSGTHSINGGISHRDDENMAVHDVPVNHPLHAEETRFLNARYNEDVCQLYSLGRMDVPCVHCGALNFHREGSTGCCSNGKIQTDIFDFNYPVEWRPLISEPDHPDYKHLHQYIRHYNSLLSLTSTGANLVDCDQRIYKVQGLIMHNIYNQVPAGQVPKHNQCYFYDPAEATEMRRQRDRSNKLRPNLLEYFDAHLRQFNPYVATHMNFVEMEKPRAAAGGTAGIKDMCIVFNVHPGDDLRRYNRPTANEIAAVYTLPLNGVPTRDIVVYPRSNGQSGFPSTKVNPASANLIPMAYMLFYPNGARGWTPGLVGLLATGVEGRTKNISQREFYNGQLCYRPNVFNPLLYGKKLTQQWIVDIALLIVELRMLFLRQNQNKLHVESYLGLQDYLASAATDVGGTVGKRVICPSSSVGSDRWYRQVYLDAIAIMQRMGRPDLFITITCSPDWPEITENLFPGQKWYDRPDLVCRVFHLRIKEILDDIVKRGCFGEVKAWNYTVEFQKRGLPHIHLLVILQDHCKITTVEQVDEIITAELPDPDTEPMLFALVKKALIHGPCDIEPETRTCRDSGSQCRYHYPHDFRDETELPSNGFPRYRRRPGPTAEIYCKGRKVTIDNRWVVPYNKALCQRHQCHINVEACTSVRAVKYIYKYQHKGGDRGCLTVQEGDVLVYDEISARIKGMVMTASEGMWLLRAYQRYGRSHAVSRLPVHLENQQNVTFQQDKVAEALARASRTKTMLTAFFALCASEKEGSTFARTLLYERMPEHFTFKNGAWTPRKPSRWSGAVIGRIYSVSPKDPERYYARLLLLKRPGPKSYEDLRTVDDVVYPSFREAAVAMGLVRDDNEWTACLEEACAYAMPGQLRSLFASILGFNQPRDALMLWETFKEHLTEDYLRNHPADVAEMLALRDIQRHLECHRMNLTTYGFQIPQLDHLLQEVPVQPQQDEVEQLILSLNSEQRIAFDAVKAALDDPSTANRCFFIDGPGGSGKTYTYKALQTYGSFVGKCIISMATTGIAADLLLNGKTMHSGFAMPLNMDGSATVTLKRNSRVYRELREADCIIIDEASAIRSEQLDYISEVLKYVMQSEQSFGSKVIVLGGDFRQTMPVIRGATPAAVLRSVLKASSLWNEFTVLRLKTNVRAQGHDDFCNWLLHVGDGKLPSPNGEYPGYIHIPEEYISPSEDIVGQVYEDAIQLCDKQALAERIVVTPKNADARKLNEDALKKITNPSEVYLSSDEVDDEEDSNDYPPEFLNSQTPSGMPPHKLELKVGCVVMLLRNLQIDSGLLNGTRLIIIELRRHIIVAEILKGSRAGTRVFIPRITCTSSDGSLPFELRRTQFPVALSFVMTINKSQGQSFDRVGVYLPSPVFSHGQLYVALSRTRDPRQLFVSIPHNKPPGVLMLNSTINVVWNEVLN